MTNGFFIYGGFMWKVAFVAALPERRRYIGAFLMSLAISVLLGWTLFILNISPSSGFFPHGAAEISNTPNGGPYRLRSYTSGAIGVERIYTRVWLKNPGYQGDQFQHSPYPSWAAPRFSLVRDDRENYSIETGVGFPFVCLMMTELYESSVPTGPLLAPVTTKTGNGYEIKFTGPKQRNYEVTLPVKPRWIGLIANILFWMAVILATGVMFRTIRIRSRLMRERCGYCNHPLAEQFPYAGTLGCSECGKFWSPY